VNPGFHSAQGPDQDTRDGRHAPQAEQ
jgi:hypothetical protein